MATILKGAAVNAVLNEKTLSFANELRAQGVIPTLCIIRVGDRKDDIAYENGAMKRCASTGVEVITRLLPQTVSESELLETVRAVNADSCIHGVLLFRPLPRHINESVICEAISPEKDVDGVTRSSMASVYSGVGCGFAPCTAQAVIELADCCGIALEGKNVVVVGRSLVIGKPVAMLLIKRNATVTICHTRTVGLASICAKADIIIAAAGKAGMIGAECVSPSQTVIDVGINWDEKNNRVCGDVDFDTVSPIVNAITPVPGGVGGITTSVLAAHVVQSAMAKQTL